MQRSFQLSCESTADLPFSYLKSRDVSVIFYSYTVDGVSYTDDMLRDGDALPRFYKMLSQGKFPKTSQINAFDYYEYFDKLLENGDVLHVAFGTGMSQSVQNAYEVVPELLKKHPSRKLVVIDSLCSSSGYGMLVDVAADMRDSGQTLQQVADFLTANRTRVHHQFFSTDLSYYRKSGRISVCSAVLGTVMGICPLMRLNKKGQIVAFGKVMGKRKALARTLDEMAEHADGGADYGGKCFVCHSNCISEATSLAESVKNRFKNVKEVKICDIGTIIASHSGPGTVAVFFFGDERPE